MPRKTNNKSGTTKPEAPTTENKETETPKTLEEALVRITELEGIVSGHEKTISEKEGELETCGGRVKELELSLGGKEGELAKAVSDISDLDALVKSHESTILEKNTELEEAQARIAELEKGTAPLVNVDALAKKVTGIVRKSKGSIKFPLWVSEDCQIFPEGELANAKVHVKRKEIKLYKATWEDITKDAVLEITV